MTTLRYYNKISDSSILGGKGASLYKMINEGFNVPPFFVVLPEVYRGWLHMHGESNDFAKAAIPIEFIKDTEKEYCELFGSDMPVAVRSSGNIEDSRFLTFAGIFHTELNVIGISEIIKAVTRCYESVFSDRARSYIRQREVSPETINMSIIIQKMISSESSGVMLTADSVNRNRYEVLIEAIWGVGEALVQGEVTPDSFVIDKSNSAIISETISKKNKMLKCQEKKSGLEKISVASNQIFLPAISKNFMKELMAIGLKLEEIFDYYQDVEWATYEDKLYILQSRPLPGSLLYRTGQSYG